MVASFRSMANTGGGFRLLTAEPASGDDITKTISHRLEALDPQCLGQPLTGPLLKGLVRRHRLEIGPRIALHLDRIGAKPVHDGREHRIRAAKGAEQERTLAAV